MSFRKAVRLQKILTYIAVGLLFIALIFYFTYEIKFILAIVALVLFLASFVISYVFVRCPHCGRKLRTVFFVIPQACPRCHCDLDYED